MPKISSLQGRNPAALFSTRPQGRQTVPSRSTGTAEARWAACAGVGRHRADLPYPCCQGLSSGTPVASKSARLRVSTTRLCTSAVAAIRPSRNGLGLGPCRAAPRKGRHHGLLEPVAQQRSLGWLPPFGQQHPQLQFVEGDRREEQAAVPCQSAPCATPTQGWYQPDPSGQISRPGQLPVVRQGEIEILHAGHGEQIDSNTWAGRPRSVMHTAPWLAARLAHGRSERVARAPRKATVAPPMGSWLN